MTNIKSEAVEAVENVEAVASKVDAVAGTVEEIASAVGAHKVADVAGAVEAVAETTQLTINDLQGLASVIDLASRRGAFQAIELGQVGAVYTKIHNFLQYITKQAEANKPAEGDSTDTLTK